MQLIVQLISPDFGTLVIDGKQGNADPDGINDLKQVLKRSDISDGVMRSVVVELGFQQLSKQFILNCINKRGPDAVIDCNIFQYNTETRLFDIIYFTGGVEINSLKQSEDFCRLSISQTGFQQNVLNNASKEFDLESTQSLTGDVITAISPQTVRLHSKRILYQFNGTGVGDFVSATVPAGQFLSIDPADITINEIKNKANLGINISALAPNPAWTMEEQGDYTFAIYVESNYNVGFGMADTDVYYSINGGAEVAFLRINDTAFRSTWNLNTTLSLNKGDTFRWYFKNHGAGDAIIFINTFTAGNPLRVNVQNLSNSDGSTAKCFFLHDAIRQALRLSTGVNDCLKSDLLNRSELGGVDGDAALDFVTVGNLIRKRDKKYFSSFKNLAKVVSDFYCASYGFETDDNNVQRVVIEPRSYFFDNTNYSINLGKVYGIERKINYSRLFNSFVVGYSTQIDIGQVNAVDGFNTLRSYILALINSENNENYSNTIIGDGYQIEYQRRLITSTADGKYDDKPFIIKGFRDSGYRAAKDDNYELITGVLDPSSGYNYDLSPVRILERWKQYLSQNLIYADAKMVNFSSGTGNYEMSTKKVGGETVYENGNIDLKDVSPLVTPYDIYFTKGLSNKDFATIKKYPYRYILFQDNNGTNFGGFIGIDGIIHNPTEETAEFNLIEMYSK